MYVCMYVCNYVYYRSGICTVKLYQYLNEKNGRESNNNGNQTEDK